MTRRPLPLLVDPCASWDKADLLASALQLACRLLLRAGGLHDAMLPLSKAVGTAGARHLLRLTNGGTRVACAAV